MKIDKYILAVDHGTSGVKSAIVSVQGQVLDTESQSTPITFFSDGGAEQDPADWWAAFLKTAAVLIKRTTVPKTDIVAVCVSSTFSTTVAVDQNGEPVMPAITWMDTRGAPFVQQAMAGFPSLMGYGLKKVLKWIFKTGGAPTLSGKDDIGHLLLMQHKFPEEYKKTRMFLPSKDFFNLKLCGLMAASYDSMTLFWVTNTRNINKINYDDELIRSLGIHRSKLPPLKPSTAVLGCLQAAVADQLGLPRSVKVISGSPDHQAAGIGAGSIRDFDGHIYIGTSSWVQCTVPFKKTDIFHSIASLPTAIPGKYYAANEQDMAGGCLSFLKKILSPTTEGFYQHINTLAAQACPGSHGLIFTPWLNGERTPVDDHNLRGGFYNLAKTTGRKEFVRAVLEGVAFNTRWSLQYVEKFINQPMNPINIVGGGAQSDLWCQIHADVLNRTIRRVQAPKYANARGAALIAAVGLGEIRFNDIPDLIEYDCEFIPQAANQKIYNRMFKEFVHIYQNNHRMFKRLNSGH